MSRSENPLRVQGLHGIWMTCCMVVLLSLIGERHVHLLPGPAAKSPSNSVSSCVSTSWSSACAARSLRRATNLPLSRLDGCGGTPTNEEQVRVHFVPRMKLVLPTVKPS